MVSITIDANFGSASSQVSGTALDFSSAAAHKLQALQQEEGNSDLKLRVKVYGGGCSGFQYSFELDEEIREGDKSVEQDGATLLVDQMSYQYLAGSEVDYTEGLGGAMFVVKNPNAASTCGCGASFSV